MPITLDPVTDDGPPPPAVDVAVVGGGIVGVSAALALARQGASVAVFEKGRVGGEQSGRNWGFVRQQGRDAAEIPLAKRSLELWGGLSEAAGRDTGFRRTGVTYVTDDPTALERWERYLVHAREHQIGSRLMTAAEARDAVPAPGRNWIAGLHTPGDGRAEPSQAAPAIAQAARRHGATIHAPCAVRGLELQAGQVSAVVTEHGRVRAGAVVCAGGAWSSLFLRRYGVVLPQLRVMASVLRTTPAPAVLDGGLTTPEFSMRRRLDGGYNVAISGRWTVDIMPDTLRWAVRFWPAFMQQRRNMRLRAWPGRFLDGLRQGRPLPLDQASPFETVREWDPTPDPRVVRDGLARMKAAFPALGDVDVAGSWAGMIDVTPDAVPVISPVTAIPGLYAATGFSGHGFALGPAAGQLVADLVTGATPLVDPTPFRLDRLRTARIAAEPAP